MQKIMLFSYVYWTFSVVGKSHRSRPIKRANRGSLEKILSHKVAVIKANSVKGIINVYGNKLKNLT